MKTPLITQNQLNFPPKFKIHRSQQNFKPVTNTNERLKVQTRISRKECTALREYNHKPKSNEEE